MNRQNSVGGRIDLIAKTHANGVIFVSGDRHWADLSVQAEDAPYPLFDLTSSALNQVHPRGTPTDNRYRAIEPPQTTYHLPNYGRIDLDWETGAANLEIRDESGNTRISRAISLSELEMRFGGSEALGNSEKMHR